MIHFEDEYFIFHAGNISATFSDGITIELDSISSKPFTPLGYEWILFDSSSSSSSLSLYEDDNEQKQINNNKDDDETTTTTTTTSTTNALLANHHQQQLQQHIVRLYVITPEQDWRNITTTATTTTMSMSIPEQYYSWKLNSAWMSNDHDNTTTTNNDWIHWNVEGYINSEIQVKDNSTLFTCDAMTFHFDPIMRGGKISTMYGVSVALEKIVLKDVQLGAIFKNPNPNKNNTNNINNNQTTTAWSKEEEEEEVEEEMEDYVNKDVSYFNDYKVYRPCPSTTTYCALVDGRVVGTSNRGDGTTADPPSNSITMGVVGILVAVTMFLISISCWIIRAQRASLYQRLEPTPGEDLTLHIHDDEDNGSSRGSSSSRSSSNVRRENQQHHQQQSEASSYQDTTVEDTVHEGQFT